MKKKFILPAFCALGALLFFVFIAARAEPATGRTEEYIVVEAKPVGTFSGNFLYMRVITPNDSLEVEWEKIKFKKEFSIVPLVKKLNELNTQGFEVISSTTPVYGSSTAIFYQYSYTLRRKL